MSERKLSTTVWPEHSCGDDLVVCVLFTNNPSPSVVIYIISDFGIAICKEYCNVMYTVFKSIKTCTPVISVLTVSFCSLS